MGEVHHYHHLHHHHHHRRSSIATVTAIAFLILASASAIGPTPTQQLGGERESSSSRRSGTGAGAGSGAVDMEGGVMGRRRLGGPGSSPPTCRSKCGRCTPCKPVHVPIQPGFSLPLEYYPEAWRCKCGNKLFMP